MKANSVMLNVYVADAMAKVLRVWRMSMTPGNVVLVKDLTVMPDANGYVKVTVDGLIPGTWYSYGFFEEDTPGSGSFIGRSLIGEVRTALAPGVKQTLTFVMAGCNGGYYDPDSPPSSPFTWESMTVAAQQDYDLFLHLGDQAYMDTVFSKGGTYDTYLEAWGAYHAGGYREVFPKAGLYCTWDDHEVTDNGDVDPWSMDPSDVAKIENAIEAYYTVLPIDSTTSMDPLWRSFRWGDTAEFIVLDSRYERLPRDDDEYISQQQMAWFKDTLQNSPCTFKVILSSVPFATLTGWFSIAQDDRWEGYQVQRQEIVDFINQNNITGVVWTAGDIHTSYVGTVEPQGGGLAGSQPEICVTSGNSNPVAFLLNGTQFPYKTGDATVPVVTLDPNAGTVNVKMIDMSGQIAYERTF